MAEKHELLPCPACGSTVDADECPYPVGAGLFKVTCTDPECSFSAVGLGPLDAVKQWNRRALSSPAPAQVGAELATVKEGNWAYTEDGRHVQVWRITQDNGVYCSDLKYHCASKLFAALAPTPQEVNNG